MNNKMVAGLRLSNILIVLGTAVGILTSVASTMLTTPVEAQSNPNQEAIDHITEAQSALDNGDTEGAKGHLDLAKKSLDCDRAIDPNC